MIGAPLEAQHVSKIARERGRQVRDVSLFLNPGEVVALVSQSEGSRMLLFDILLGRTRPSEGRVVVGGTDIYQNRKRLRPIVGFVAKDDILPAELTVAEALHDAAKIRMPGGTSGEARLQHVDQLLADLELARLQGSRMKALTPEQRKWVHIAVELVSNPSLLLLDEPECGLGPGGDGRLARLLRKLAAQGLAILLSAGTSTSVITADRVFVLLDGGYMGWFGPPAEAQVFFNNPSAAATASGNGTGLAGTLAGLRISGESEAQEWAERYRSHPAYKTYLSPPKKEKQPDLMLDERPLAYRREKPAPEEPPAVPVSYSAFGQLFTLLFRNLKLLARDRLSMLLMLGLPFLAGGIDTLITYRQMYDPFSGSAERIVLALAMIIFSVMLLSGIPWIREMQQEAGLVHRERQISLRLVPFVLSKTWLAGLFALYQAFVWTLIYFLLVKVPGGLLPVLYFFVTLYLVSLTGALFALLASKLVNSSSGASLVFLVLLLPQVLFSGAVQGVAPPASATGALASIFPLTMGFKSLVTAGGHGKDVYLDVCLSQPEEVRSQMTARQKSSCTCLGSNIFTECNFPGIRGYLLSAGVLNEADLPALDLEVFRLPVQPAPGVGMTVEAYKGEVDRYTSAIEQRWRDIILYVEDQTRFSLAIGHAEGLVKSEFDQFGPALYTSLPTQWAGLLLSAVVLILFFSGAVKMKDG
ncbi:MAG TPA: ATP-binding cassette domain-containing protein [Anaerolineales bacterium]|nr:ATP-binding cassette domain-containing protein [Anaerolineales bacterium]